MPQWRVYPPVCSTYGAFGIGLVFGLVCSCRKRYTAIVIGKVFKYCIDLRLIPVRLYDCSLEVVRNKYLRNTAEELQC